MEEWRPVLSIPGVEASSLGRIRLPAKVIKMPNGGTRTCESEGSYGTTRRASKHATHSYKGISIRGVGNKKVHRLVCEAFHGPAPFPSAVVLHINDDAHDNRPGNLRWGTQKENLNMPGFIAICRARAGRKIIRGAAS